MGGLGDLGMRVLQEEGLALQLALVSSVAFTVSRLVTSGVIQ